MSLTVEEIRRFDLFDGIEDEALLERWIGGEPVPADATSGGGPESVPDRTP